MTSTGDSSCWRLTPADASCRGSPSVPWSPIRRQANGDGYLLILYNRKDEGISTGFEQLKFEPNSAGTTIRKGPWQAPDGALKGEALKKFQRLRGMEQYQNMLAYRVAGMRKNDINHFFLTLLSDKQLENYQQQHEPANLRDVGARQRCFQRPDHDHGLSVRYTVRA